LVLHDPLCPLTPVSFLRQAAEVAEADDVVVVGVQPVTDTIKATRDGAVGSTVDRDGLWAVTSPVVLPGSLVERLDGWPDEDDFPTLVATLRESCEVRFLEAPVLARRVEDESAIALLEELAAGQTGQAGQVGQTGQAGEVEV
jgi:2-C-methyl-D-erythritol 4-phosphate cytidylyltransferase